MNPTDTIVALATGWTWSRRAMIRVSGTGVRDLFDPTRGVLRLRYPARENSDAFEKAPCVAPVGIRLASDRELPALALMYAGPRSYTSEDSVELLIPGSPLVIERVLSAILGVPGVREATPGEFSARAYLNGKLTIDQAEGVAATIAARTRDELDAAKRLLAGHAGAACQRWSDELVTLLALVEAGIDFTDQEDVVPIAPRELRARLESLSREITDALGARRGAERDGALPRVAIAGPPNAGKSTMFNALLGRRRSVVSPVAGTTRDVIVEELDLSSDGASSSGGGGGGGAVRVLLMDLAGLDPSVTGEIDTAAQSRAMEALESASVVISCDPAGRFTLRVPGDHPIIRVRTKADLGQIAEGAEMLSVCALDGWNLGPLKRAIADAVSAPAPVDRVGAEALVPRRRRMLWSACDRIGSACAAVDATARSLVNPEVVAGLMREALDALGEVTGRVTPDDVIGRVFATFCVGK